MSAQNTNLYTVAEASLSSEGGGRNEERLLLLNVILIIKRGMLKSATLPPPLPHPNFWSPDTAYATYQLFGPLSVWGVGPEVHCATFIQT